MNKIDKAILIIFSIIILIEGIVVNLLIVGWLKFIPVSNVLENLLLNNPTNRGILLISIIFMLLAIKAIFWTAPADKRESKSGRDVLMKNDNGKLMISIETIESLVNSVVSQFNNVEDTKANIVVDEENNLSVLVNLVVEKDVVIKELSLNVQNKIKEAIKKTSDLEVKEVNVRIKNIVNVPEGENKK